MYGHNKANATFLFCVIKFKSLEIGQLRYNGTLTELKKKKNVTVMNLKEELTGTLHLH